MLQLGFRRCHSIDTTLVKIVNKTNACDNDTPLILIDLSAAFHTVDHEILLSHLETNVSVKETTLSLFRLCLMVVIWPSHVP